MDCDDELYYNENDSNSDGDNADDQNSNENKSSKEEKDKDTERSDETEMNSERDPDNNENDSNSEEDELVDDSKWSNEEKDEMNKKFLEFLRRVLYNAIIWNGGQKRIEFNDELKERKYWDWRFEEAYITVLTGSTNWNRHDLAYIHAYIYHVTDKKKLGSNKYPDRNNCLSILEEPFI